MPDFTAQELRIIARLVQNLLGSALEAGLDPGILMSIYNKTEDFLDTD